MQSNIALIIVVGENPRSLHLYKRHLLRNKILICQGTAVKTKHSITIAIVIILNQTSKQTPLNIHVAVNNSNQFRANISTTKSITFNRPERKIKLFLIHYSA